MERWVARDRDGSLFLYEQEPTAVYLNHDTSSDGSMPRHEFEYWKSGKGRIQLHPNTYLSIIPGMKRKCKIKLKLI